MKTVAITMSDSMANDLLRRTIAAYETNAAIAKAVRIVFTNALSTLGIDVDEPNMELTVSEVIIR